MGFPKGSVIYMENMYRNPFKAPDAGNTGDPFVMRYDGRYYLYFSAGGFFSMGKMTHDLHCWRSDNLVDWTYLGVACKLPDIIGGYAPEVIYNKGKFYMCTSPHGNGHFILEASKPEGPYKQVTGRFGQRIDGSFFIDDDGRSYFYRAEGNGINFHTMSDPKTVDLPGTPIGESCLNGWTEGPMVLRHGGKYFLTYTGNHLLSKCYKVAYSVSDSSPVSGYTNMKNRVVLAEVGDDFHALGHSSSALAPDMDGAYIIYHTYELVKEPHHRSMNVDRLFFNGSRMYANTIWWDQEKPSLADYSVRGTDELAGSEKDGEKLLLTKKPTPAIYTAEINVNAKGGDFELVYAGGKGRITVNDRTVRVSEGGKVLAIGELPSNIVMRSNNSYRFTRHHDGKMLLMLNNNQEFLKWNSSCKGGKIGFSLLPENAAVGFVGFSSYSDGSSDKFVTKAVPGRMDAVHAVEDHAKLACIENGRDIYCVKATVGSVFTFPINVKADGLYTVCAHVRQADAGVRVDVNGRELVAAAPTAYDRDGSAKVLLGRVKLCGGLGKLVVRAGCDFVIDSFELAEAEDVEKLTLVEDGRLCHDADIFGWKGRGSMISKEVGYSCSENDGFVYVGGHGWTDYRTDAHMTGYMNSTGSCEFMFRMQKESYFGSQPARAGYGYSVRIGCGSISLIEWNYGEKILVNYTLDDCGRFEHDVSVVAKGQKIAVSVDGKELFSYDIPMGNVSGRAGLRVTGECFGVQSMKITPV